MASNVEAGSDFDMLSQTENEDTDTGEVSSVSDTSLSQSSATEPGLGLKSKLSASDNKQEMKDLSINVGGEFTEVTDLDDDVSNVDDDTFGQGVEKVEGKTETSTISNLTFWYNNKCFDNYWKHYNQVMSWCQKHFEVYNDQMRRMTAKSQNVSLLRNHDRRCREVKDRQGYMKMNFPDPVYAAYHPYTNLPTCSTCSVSMNTNKSTERRKRKAKHRKKKPKSSSEVSCTESEMSEVIEMEVTQDMIDFYAKTMEHRIKRDQAKKAEALEASTQPDHVNVEDVKFSESRKPTVEAPKERPGARRTAEMKLLYGKGAAMIHGMETALQMTFDRNMDVKQPKLWPNMPLRVIFG